MRIVALLLAALTVSVCLGFPVEEAKLLNVSPVQKDERGPVSAEIDDSELFFQNALRTKGPARDNSQKIEALLKRMTLEEKVGQMTQLAIGMVPDRGEMARDH